MLLTPHTLVGIAVATIIKNPLVAFPVSVGMHYLGDLVPHWDFFSNTEAEERTVGWRPLAIMGELTLAVSIGTTFILYSLWKLDDPQLAFRIFICGIGSVLPDLLGGLKLYLKNADGFLSLNDKIQARLQFQSPLPWGILTQVAVSVFCFLLILNSIGR